MQQPPPPPPPPAVFETELAGLDPDQEIRIKALNAASRLHAHGWIPPSEETP